MEPLTMGLIGAGGLKTLGGLFSAGGASTANKKNRAAKDSLRFLAENYRAYGAPLLESMQSGYAPGGFLRGIMAAPGVGAANRRASGEADAARRSAWRKGGAGSGAFLRALRDADATRGLGTAEALAEADLGGMQQLARINAMLLGSADAFPVSIAQNKNLGIAQGLGQFSDQVTALNTL